MDTRLSDLLMLFLKMAVVMLIFKTIKEIKVSLSKILTIIFIRFICINEIIVLIHMVNHAFIFVSVKQFKDL